MYVCDLSSCHEKGGFVDSNVGEAHVVVGRGDVIMCGPSFVRAAGCGFDGTYLVLKGLL